MSLQQSPSALTLEGSADLWIIFEYVDAAYARTLLPDYLTLGPPPPGTPAGAHLMMHSFGTHTVRLHSLRWIPLTYRETIIGVCGAELKAPANYRGPYSVMTSASVDSLLPTLLGRLLGYPKSFTRNIVTDRSFRMRTILTGRDLMCGQFEDGAEMSPAQGSPLLTIAEPILLQPVISRAVWGTLQASRFSLEKETWVFAPVDGAARVTGDELRGLSPGLHAWRRIDATGVGAFRSRHEWSWKWPIRAGESPAG
jgi:hypothetical protein